MGPTSENAYSGSVLNLVGTNFYRSVQNRDKDVLVDVYAPWCGHSVRLKPNYQKLGKKLAHVKTLDIAWIDGSANDVDGYPVDGFPTIMFFPAGSKKSDVQQYKGDRSTDDMVQWLHKHVTHAFSDTPPKQPEANGEAV